jgi:hypothetical protein
MASQRALMTETGSRNHFEAMTDDDNLSAIAENQSPISIGRHFAPFMEGLINEILDAPV